MRDFLPASCEPFLDGGRRTRGLFRFGRGQAGELPLVTVVTVVRNGAAYIEDSIRSVLCQSYPNIEYIIIDGVSTDGTVDIIRSFEDDLDYWVSCPDDGIYDAMNKGIGIATGRIVGLLNSDDWYERDAVERVVQRYQRTENIGIFHGKIRMCGEGGERPVVRCPPKQLWRRYFTTPFKHPSCFVLRDVYEQINGYDQTYRFAADYDFMLRAIRAGINAGYIPQVLTNVRRIGATTGTQLMSSPEDIAAILRKHSGSRAIAELGLAYRKVRRLLRRRGREAEEEANDKGVA